MLQKAGRDQMGCSETGQKHEWPVGVVVMAESGQKQMEGEPADAAGVHPALEKFGGGQNEQNGLEAWRDQGAYVPLSLFWGGGEITCYSEHLEGREKRPREE